MSTGTTSDFALTRNEVIASALRKVRGWPEDGNPPVHKLREAIRALNLVIRSEDLKQTGLAKSAWALDTTYLPLVAGRYIIGQDEGLPAIQELISVTMRDVNGADSGPLDIVSFEEYTSYSAKNETGDPLRVYLKRARVYTDQKLYLWPAHSSVTAGDTVVQSDYTYTCILGHTSSSENKPGSGASWQLYWKLGNQTLTADTWVTATEYDNGETLVLNYKRPLYDFDGPYDNPDMPLGWEDYLIYKLALRLAPEYGLDPNERVLLKQDMAQIEQELVPAAREKTNTAHNKACFY